MLQLTATELQQGEQRESPGRGRHEDQAELKQQFSVQIEDRMQAAAYGEELHVASECVGCGCGPDCGLQTADTGGRFRPGPWLL